MMNNSDFYQADHTIFIVVWRTTEIFSLWGTGVGKMAGQEQSSTLWAADNQTWTALCTSNAYSSAGLSSISKDMFKMDLRRQYIDQRLTYRSSIGWKCINRLGEILPR